MRWPHTLVLQLALVVLASCSGRRWQPADPDHPNRISTVRGRLESVDDAGAERVVLRIRPRDDVSSRILEGQSGLSCALVPPARREDFTGVLEQLRIGQEIEISGYLVRDTEHHVLVLRPITAIDLFP